MIYINIVKYVLLIIPIVIFILILLFMMSQGKQNLTKVAKRGAGGLRRWLALVLLLSVVYGAGYLMLEQLRMSVQASAVIGFNYQEASNGLNPNKTRFNSSELISDEVLRTAIANGNFNNVGIEDLRACLKVTPLKAGESLSLSQNYIATEYQLTYEAGLKTGHLAPGTVIDMVSHAYYENFVDAYTRKTDVLTMDFNELEDLDYLDICELFDIRAEAIENYAGLLTRENASFQSETTGETFSSIQEKVRNFRNVQLERYEAFILTYGISKNKSQYIAKLNYDNRITSIDYLKNVATHEINLEAIDLYQRDMARIVLVPSEDEDGKYYMSRTKIGVDYFADEAEKSMQQAAKQQLQVETNNYAIKQLLSANPTDAQVQQLDLMLENIKEEYQVLSDLAVDTLADYDKKTTNNYISILINHQSHVGGEEIRKALLLTIVMLLLLCALFVTFPYKNSAVTAHVKETKEKKPGKIRTERVKKGKEE